MSVLVVTSPGAANVSVTPVLAALEASGAKVRAIDAGRAGAAAEGTVDRMIRAIVGEVFGRRMQRELRSNPPDAMVAFDPATSAALTMVRDESSRSAPVVSVIGELEPGSDWANVDADRYLVLDDEAAEILSERDVPAERILVVGPICEQAYVEAAGQGRVELRKQFGLDSKQPIVVVDMTGFGAEDASQMALQLSLSAVPATYLFDASGSREAAILLRRQVPTLDMRAKLFGATKNAARLWRCANAVVSRPRSEVLSRALVLGAKMVSYGADSLEQRSMAQAIEMRGMGAACANTLLVSSALDRVLRESSNGEPSSQAEHATVGQDGARSVADIVCVVASERRAVISERAAQSRQRTRERARAATDAAQAAAKAASVAGELEDLSGQAPINPEVEVPDAAAFARIRAELKVRLGNLEKAVFEAREMAQEWEKTSAKALEQGDSARGKSAARNADLERARMHSALAEMAALQGEITQLEQAEAAMPRSMPDNARHRPRSAPKRRHKPPRQSVDDMLEDLKRREASGATIPRKKSKKRRRQKPTQVEDELAALKKKMESKKK